MEDKSELLHELYSKNASKKMVKDELAKSGQTLASGMSCTKHVEREICFNSDNHCIVLISIHRCLKTMENHL